MPESSKAVARYDGPRTIDDLSRYAMVLAVNTLPDGTTRRNDALPVAFRGNPAAVAFVTEYAKALDVSPVTAIIGIHFVDGKPSASAGLISALVRRAGHRIRTWTEGTIEAGTFKAVTTIVREDDPDFEYRSEWTVDRAVRAKLMRRTDDGRVTASKAGSGWDNYPENMCKARTITEAARDAAEDAILGVHYTPEELGADVDPETGDVVHTVTQVSPPPPPAAPAAAPPAETPAQDTPEDRAVDDQVEAVRRWVFDARTEDEIREAWTQAIDAIGRFYPGQAITFRDFLTADENDVEVDLLALFGAAGQAIKAGTYLTKGTRYDREDGTPAAGVDPTPPPAVPETGAQGRDVTLEEAVAKAAGDEEVVDGVVVDEEVVDGVVVEDTPARAALDAVMRELDADAVAAVVGWCRQEGVNPSQGEDACSRIVDAIRTGVALPVSFPVDPEELLVAVLGATVLERVAHTTQEERHAAMLANRVEDRADAAATHTGGRPVPGDGVNAYRAARAAAAAGRE